MGLLWYPPTWTIQARNIAKTFAAFGSKATHESMLQDILQHENYARFTHAGLAVKVGELDDIAQYQKLFERLPLGIGRLAKAGNRGMDVLKNMRMDIANKWYNTRLTAAEKAEVQSGSKAGEQILEELMGLVNTATGTIVKNSAVEKTISGRASIFWSNAFFAPRLEAARWQDVMINPLRAAQLSLASIGRTLTPAEQSFRRLVIRQNVVRAMTYMGALGLNQYINNYTTNEKINALDFSKSDYLSFKIHGHTLTAPSSFLSPLRITLVSLAAGLLPVEKRTDVLSNIADYAAGKANPVFNDFLELRRGRQSFTGRPLPWASRDTPKGWEPPKTPLSWGEYALSKSPIPFAQTAQEHYALMREYGLGPTAAKVLIGDGLALVASMFATHVHVTPPEKPGANPVTLQDYKHPFSKRGNPSGGL